MPGLGRFLAMIVGAGCSTRAGDTLLKARMVATRHLKQRPLPFRLSRALSVVDALRVFSVKPPPFLEDVPVFLVVVSPYRNHYPR